jgi:hypothetical protein
MADLDEKLRPIASQIPQQATPPDQQQQPRYLTPMGWMAPDTLSNLWRLLMTPLPPPLTENLANIAGAPVDSLASALHQMGLSVPGGPGPDGVWRPSASIPLGSQQIRGLLDYQPSFNPPSLDTLLRAARRPGLL